MQEEQKLENSRIYSFIRGLLLPYIDERNFIVITIVVLGVTITNLAAQNIFGLIMQDFRLAIGLLMVFGIFSMIVFSKENLPDSFKVFACVVYYFIFAIIAYEALGKQNSQIYNDSLWSHINLLILNVILWVSVIRGIALSIMTKSGGEYDGKITPSFKDDQYTIFGHSVSIIVSILSGIVLGYFIKDVSNAILLGSLAASIIISIAELIVSKPMKYQDKKYIQIQ